MVYVVVNLPPVRITLLVELLSQIVAMLVIIDIVSATVPVEPSMIEVVLGKVGRFILNQVVLVDETIKKDPLLQTLLES